MLTIDELIRELRAEIEGCGLTRQERRQAKAELARLLAQKHERDRAFEATLEAEEKRSKVMCKILNAKIVGTQPAPDRVYIGRPSLRGNPFKIGRDGTRDQVIDKYRAWILRQPKLLARLHELRGKDLVCWCAPARCHAEVLIELGL